MNLRQTTAAACAAIATGISVTACGIPAPEVATPTTVAHTQSTTSLTDAVPAPERGGKIPATARREQRRLARGAGASSPVHALETYARLWATWTAKDVVTRQKQLAEISLGQARAQAQQAAASFAADTKLTRSDVASTGQAIAVTRGRGPAADQWVVVTSETTTGTGQYEGLPATLHITYVQLTRRHGQFVVSSWSPQS